MPAEVAYVNPGTDSQPPVSEYRGREHLNPSIVHFVEEFTAPRNPAVYRVWVDGTLHRLREFDRVRTWILASQAVTATSQRITAEKPSTRLSAEIESSITKLVNLPQGWDGYNGLPVQPDVAEHARRFLALIRESTQLVPDIIPLSDGGLQLEWFVGAYEVEVVIALDGTAHVYFECTEDGRICEESLDSSFNIEKIAPYFQELRL